MLRRCSGIGSLHGGGSCRALRSRRWRWPSALLGFAGAGSAKAQDWTDYLHWPYVPPQVPGNGFEYKALYDGWYLYPREQRIVPADPGAVLPQLLRRLAGILGFAHPHGGTTGWNKKQFYQGYHFALDVF